MSSQSLRKRIQADLSVPLPRKREEKKNKKKGRKEDRKRKIIKKRKI